MNSPFQFPAKLGPVTLAALLTTIALPAGAQTAQQLSDAVAAASTAAQGNQCNLLGGFYWELGNANGVLGGSTVPANGAYNRNSDMELASASKWAFGAFALEDLKAKGFAGPSTSQTQKLVMTSGYTRQNALTCLNATTVDQCLGTTGPVASRTGAFYYDGQHLQKLLSDLGYGSLTTGSMQTAYDNTLGAFGWTVANVSASASLTGSAADYAGFLTKIIKGELEMGARLGESAVCTHTALLANRCVARGLPRGQFSPVTEPWDYSYAHWVEKENGTTVDAYSSPGLYGFYPWISANKAYYGIVARKSNALNAYTNSVDCGRAIRKAFEGSLRAAGAL